MTSGLLTSPEVSGKRHRHITFSFLWPLLYSGSPGHTQPDQHPAAKEEEATPYTHYSAVWQEVVISPLGQ
ncbi:unnamed protein product [Protopolystoma xenopodis]|uniref:Uncharacterized protein n=1 Tax=Protopolystoma xenopodis TaxID=117903 RepID=A0A3S5AZ65_9PLAT|nr:unnamed protein product [Protopolystoma xenopodis]